MDPNYHDSNYKHPHSNQISVVKTFDQVWPKVLEEAPVGVLEVALVVRAPTQEGGLVLVEAEAEEWPTQIFQYQLLEGLARGLLVLVWEEAWAISSDHQRLLRFPVAGEAALLVFLPGLLHRQLPTPLAWADQVQEAASRDQAGPPQHYFRNHSNPSNSNSRK